MVAPESQPSLLSRPVFRRAVVRASLGGAILFFLIGIVFWGGFNTAMEETNTLDFCIGCHEMEENVYEEYKPTIHYSNRTGVRATCSDCHVPDPWVHKVVRKIQATGEVYHKIMGSVATPAKFEARRLHLARRVWKSMKEADSRECRNCHNLESMSPAKQKPRARKQHMLAFEKGYTCIDCHKGIAHRPVHKEMDEEELQALEEPNPAFKRQIPHQWVVYFAKEEAAKKGKLAAAKTPASEPAAAAPAPAAAVAVAASGEAAMDWRDVPSREVVLFYPGQSSMEWLLTGRDHSGVRAFNYGDRCFDCHDQEAEAIGQKIVTGEKLEPNPIPGKRGSIPVTVQAAHDGESLYMRFQWPDAEHAPVPFVEGGKMDPDNPIKLAVMLATDDVEYADRAACWNTCHHDLRTMPGAPDAGTLQDSSHAGALNLSEGVTKYIGESRSEIEVAGKDGKPRGGWDKLKPADAVKAEVDAGRFLDLLRFKSGTGETEDGHVLAERVMSGGQGFTATGELKDGTWTVVLKRKLASDKEGDLGLALDKTYNVGFAIHDDFSTARYHHVSVDYDLGFDNADVEINAVKRAPTATAAPVVAQAAAPAATETPASAAGEAGIDWSRASAREVVLFYPGQSSMEWLLTGRDHSGVRAFNYGDRCFDCHDQEAEAIGQKIVTGEKLEPNPIPGKRGSIPVTVQAAHDGESLHMRFQWPDGEHAPVPFVEGGKMDPDNPIKLAVMLATDDVEYADRAACWSTCHHDLRTMPGAPEADALQGNPHAGALNLSGGVTKYIGESRSEIEVAGKDGKPRGGWDKLKPADAVKAEMEAGRFLDLLRYSAGTGETEDGHVLAERVMSGGQGFTATGELKGGTWTVVLSRKLASDAAGDLSLALDKTYNISFAVHDDFSTARYHHVSVDYDLGFDNADVEINAIGQ